MLLWLGEIAAMRAVGEWLGPAWMTVGASHDSSHLAPTPVGDTVTVSATLVAVEGRRLVFDVRGHDHRGEVLRGRHVRGVVDRDRFRRSLGI